MEAWIECGENFIKCDVLRWAEPVFEERRSRARKPVFLGEREVIAELLSEGPDSKGLLTLLVRRCRIASTSKNANAPCPALIEPGTEIRRQPKTLLKHALQRLEWSDESARDLVASRFLNERPPALPRTAAPSRKRPAASRKRRK